MSGLFSLLDDIATLAKLAASSLDDVALAAGRASTKAAGVIIDDTAVTPQYLKEISPERELPIIKKIALGSLKNKILIILPIALLLSQLAPFLLPPLMILGGSYLAFEGMEKILERFLFSHSIKNQISSLDSENFANREAKIVSDAVRTDLILSAEIMVIALNEVTSQGVLARGVILIIVALLITFLVYGVVALLVKMDDFGLMLAHRQTKASQKIGTAIIYLMPKILGAISVIGVFAMIWVGGHIVANSCAELGWHFPHHLIENAAFSLESLAGTQNIMRAIFFSLGETITAFIAGAIWGGLLALGFLGGKKILKI